VEYPRRDFVVETAWLQANLSDPRLRIIDCRINLSMDEAGDVRFSSAREDWLAAHIPGAVHVDIAGELSHTATDLPFMLPPADDFADVMSRLGVDDDARVVLYDAFYNIWAARLWWMLRAHGFSNAAVLNGGWNKWNLEHRPVFAGPETRPSAVFEARPDTRFFVDKQAVLSAIGDDQTCIVDALYPDHYSGENPSWVDRPGHIESAVNLPFNRVVNDTTHAYLPPEEMASALETLALDPGGAVITYCHAGNAASSVAFAMALMGHERVAIYDGSLREWAADSTLPMQCSIAD
jgi:thiosulfate/3-mercaptopyruvate sulfurtransferase